MATYGQPLKTEVRTRILKHAVESLTTARSEAPTVTLSHFEGMYDYCRRFIGKHGRYDIEKACRPAVNQWTGLHSSKVGHRKPSDLSILYLCGPEPLNDLEVLVSLGVSANNIWAVEGDKAIAARAVGELASKFPIKLYQGSLQEFFDVVPQQFDIVYFDACGPLGGGKPATLPVLRELFANQRLAPLSVLITNFAAANQDGKSADEWKARMGVWFAAKDSEPAD